MLKSFIHMLFVAHCSVSAGLLSARGKALYFFIYIHVQLEAFSILCNTFTHKWHFSTFMDGCMWIILFFYVVPFVKWM